MSILGISKLAQDMQKDLVTVAAEFVDADIGYSFSEEEQKVLRPFFTNLDKRVFFIHSLPSNVLATLTSMYSRLKNRRGIRGVFVDSFLPGILLSALHRGDDKVELVLKKNNIKNLSDLLGHSPEARSKFEWFVERSPDAEYLEVLTDSRKAKEFLKMWLDQYGHNSIARMGEVWLCCENISILAAKSIEWTRPGVGYVELSTRFVDREGAGIYPIEKELEMLNHNNVGIEGHFGRLFHDYGDLQGNDLDGPFPRFLRERWGVTIDGHKGNVELGVAGETFDVLGNLLPAATLTSVAIAVSGESLPSILKHLILDDTPENLAIVEMVIREAGKIGADQFIRHYEPTAAERIGWSYKATIKNFRKDMGMKSFINVPDSKMTENALWEALEHTYSFSGLGRERNMRKVAEILFSGGRENHDKLPREFELITVPFWGAMSFRGWRDLHRQGFSTHRRTLLRPNRGFYRYDKPQPSELEESFGS